MSRLGSYRTVWSQQKPPSAGGKVVKGLRKVQVPPPLLEKAAYQFPVMNRTRPDIPVLGSLTVALKSEGITGLGVLAWKNRKSLGANGLCPRPAILVSEPDDGRCGTPT